MVKMLPAAALAGPQKRSIFQPDRILVDRHPGLRRLVNDVCRLTVTSIRKVQIEKSLFAVLRLVDHLLAVRRPRDARDEHIRGLILIGIDPANVAASRVNYTKLYVRI